MGSLSYFFQRVKEVMKESEVSRQSLSPLKPPVPSAGQSPVPHRGSFSYKVIQEIKYISIQEEMSAQDNTQRFKIASPGSKLVSFGGKISQSIVTTITIVMHQRRPLIGQYPLGSWKLK